jgi:hypothetical protein
MRTQMMTKMMRTRTIRKGTMKLKTMMMTRMRAVPTGKRRKMKAKSQIYLSRNVP